MALSQEPRKIVLGSKRKRVGYGPKRRLVEQDECMVYVPLLESLESLLQSDSVLAEVCIHNVFDYLFAVN